MPPAQSESALKASRHRRGTTRRLAVIQETLDEVLDRLAALAEQQPREQQQEHPNNGE